ncbi:hypothetical protein ACX01_01360 [Vibrio parahaemolyticus]|nr:hypothetical protein ACX01_01360 [Vibrio parahaemolyticus]
MLLISLTRINKNEVVEALRLYFIRGLNHDQATLRAGVRSDSVTSKAIKAVNESMRTVDKLSKYKSIQLKHTSDLN